MSPNSVCNRTHASRSSDFVNHSYDYSLQSTSDSGKYVCVRMLDAKRPVPVDPI